MVRVNWSGRLGNRMFQHLCGGIISKYSNTQYTDIQLSTKFWHYDHSIFEEYFKINPLFLGKEVGEGSEITIDDNWILNNLKNIPQLTPGNYLCNGYFQSSAFINRFKDDVLNFYQPQKPIEKQEGVFVHLRFGELEGVSSGTREYYDKALTAIQANNGYITTMPELENHENIKYLQSKYNLKFLNEAPVRLLHLVRGFDKVVVGAGSFSWWLAFTSRAPEVYYYEVPSDRKWHGDMFTGMGWKGLS